ncbi:MAG: UDP-N-acetylglucosamine 2-epimerase [Chthoniobacterales bacterium]
MSSKRKVCVVITARPSYSRIKSALAAIQCHPDLELQLVVTASALLDRYGDITKTILNDGFPIHARVFMVVEGETLLSSAKTTGFGLAELATVFDNLKPDVVVTIADRYETMATAVAAAYMNIPLAHVQGGEVTGSIDEKVRHSITKLADLHLVSTGQARERVVRMGEHPSSVHVTGCPSIDLATDILDRPELDFDPHKKYGGVGAEIDLRKEYIVVMQHPVTTECGDARRQVEETLHAVTESDLQALWFWPNIDAGSEQLASGIRAFRERDGDRRVRFFKNMMPADFLRLLKNSRCIVGNSSVAIRECAFLGVPAVNIGTRQQGRERGRNVVDVANERGAILEAIRRQSSRTDSVADPIYGDGHAGPRIADVLAVAPLMFSKVIAY